MSESENVITWQITYSLYITFVTLGDTLTMKVESFKSLKTRKASGPRALLVLGEDGLGKNGST